MAKNDYRFQLVVTEYKLLRNVRESKARFIFIILSLYLSVLSTFYVYILKDISIQKLGLIVIIPIISFALFLLFLWEFIIISNMSRYLRNMESSRIPELLRSIDKSKESEIYNWIGYQNYWERSANANIYKTAIIILFPIISVVPSIMYSAYILMLNCNYHYISYCYLAINILSVVVNIIILVFMFYFICKYIKINSYKYFA